MIEESTLNEQTAVDLAEFFQTLADASRLQIIAALLEGEQNVGALAETAAISESAASHHLRHLRQMRLVRANKRGRYVYYCLDDDHVRRLFNEGLEHVLHG